MMPPHTRYCEPFFGGGAVLLQKPCDDIAEFANDLHYELTNFWSVLREPALFERFKRFVEATEFSQIQFEKANASNHVRLSTHGEDVSGAIKFFVRARQSRQGLQTSFATPTRRLRRGMNENVSAWLTAVEGLADFHARIKRVEIRCQDAKQFIRELDSPETMFYCDPPYVHSTRETKCEYGPHEMSEANHRELLNILCQIEGKFLLSGYANNLYTYFAEVGKWHRVDFSIPNQASGKKTKERMVESVWCNFTPPESKE